MLTWLVLLAAGFATESLHRAPSLRNSLGWPFSFIKTTWRGPLSRVIHTLCQALCWVLGISRG